MMEIYEKIGRIKHYYPNWKDSYFIIDLEEIINMKKKSRIIRITILLMVVLLIVFIIILTTFINPFDPYSNDRRTLTGTWINLGLDSENDIPITNGSRIELRSDGSYTYSFYSTVYDRWNDEIGTWDLQLLEEYSVTFEKEYYDMLVLKSTYITQYFNYEIISNEKISLWKWRKYDDITWSNLDRPIYYLRYN